MGRGNRDVVLYWAPGAGEGRGQPRSAVKGGLQSWGGVGLVVHETGMERGSFFWGGGRGGVKRMGTLSV